MTNLFLKNLAAATIVLAFLAFLLLSSCTKTTQLDLDKQDTPLLSEEDALEQFAEILSGVVSCDEEVRGFLKDEALKQFDKDYDVFYPFVKDQTFSSGKTLRQLLSSYEKYKGQLNEIEKAVPKLTILIPDYSWVDPHCFSVSSWDVSNEQVCVGFDDHTEGHRLFYKGAFLDYFPSCSFPSFPVLIVKSNERISASISTKSGENEYYFADPAFDGIQSTKAWLWGKNEGYLENPESGTDLFSQTGNFISYDELNAISPSVIQAYNEFPRSANGVQRDYVYYGMTVANSTNGRLNKNMRDMLYRFRLTPEALFFISDDELGDPNIGSWLWTGRDDRPSFSEAIPRLWDLWGGGNYEMRLQFFQAYPNSGVSCVGSIVLSFSPDEIMYVDRCYNTFEWNFWGNNWSSYQVNVSDIESKWYYPGDKNNPLPIVGATWNLSKESDNLFLRVYEFDPSGSESISKSHIFKRSLSVSTSVNPNVGITDAIKLGLGVSGSWGDEISDSRQYTYTRSTSSDDLDDCEINYTDKYILTSSVKDGENGYQLETFGNAYYSVSFVPINIEDKYQIQQFLLGRRNRNNQ